VNILFKKTFPVSLTFLVIAYSRLGWFLANSEFPWIIWVVAIILTLLLAIALATPLFHITSIARYLQTMAGGFVAVIISAFGAVLILVWIEAFAYLLVLFAASALVRLDIQIAGLSECQAFWILSFISLASVGVGALLKLMFFET
jgi:hypothetical protein